MFHPERLLDRKSSIKSQCSNQSSEASFQSLQHPNPPQEIVLNWYKKNFASQDHATFLVPVSPIGPVVISLLKGRQLILDGEDEKCYSLVIRTTKGSEKYDVPEKRVERPWYRKIFFLSPSIYDILASTQSALNSFAYTLYSQERNGTDIVKDICQIEERLIIKNFKFGILYAGPNMHDGNNTTNFINSSTGLITEGMLYNSNNTSEQYLRFLDFMADKVALKGWKNYRGGLDVKENGTGSVSYYTRWNHYEIMFHVNHLLPFKGGDLQQIERKRHIGNDIVILVFNESGKDLDLSSFNSKQIHVIIEIIPSNDDFTTFLKDQVPQPILPIVTSRLPYESTSRDILLKKLIQAEKACYDSPDFASKIARTRCLLLEELINKYI